MTMLTAANCRSCGHELRHSLVDLGMTPVGARYLSAEQLSQMEPSYPLQAWVCDVCFLVQLPCLVKDGGSVSEFTYFASSAPSRLDHARRYADKAVEEFRLTPAHLVVEVGSNDGYLLQYFVQQNIPVLGIDAAVNVSRAASARGVPTHNELFDQRSARALRDRGVSPDLVIVNNVLAEVDDLNDFVAGLKILMAPRGVMTMEFPHVVSLIAENQFDTIHHGCLSYFSLLAARNILERNGLTVYDVDELDTRGGSLRVFICHSEDPLRPITPRVDSLTARERAAGVGTLDYYAVFAERVRATKDKLLDFLIDAKRDGKHVAGYGAHRKGNTLLNYCGISRELVDYTVDPDPEKHGRYLPGSHIPIRPPELIEQTRPDYVLLLSRDLQNDIVPRLESIRSWGGRCVVPIPEVHMVA